MVDIYRDAKRRGIYPSLFIDPEATISSSEPFAKRRTIFLSVRKTECRRIFQVTGANQNARKLLSTDLVNTNI